MLNLLDDTKYPLPDITSTISSSAKDIWNKEYGKLPTIPSSHRGSPSHALVEIMGKLDIESGQVADIGCGNGRNSAYLAQLGFSVSALDFSDVALDLAKNTIDEFQLSDKVDLTESDILDGLPWEDDSIDVVLDAYCLCHFVDVQKYEFAVSECRRILKPNGIIIKIHIDDNDDYYRNLSSSIDGLGTVSFDPANGLQKRHFSRAEFSDSLGKDFIETNFLNLNFIDSIRGAEFVRSIFASSLKVV